MQLEITWRDEQALRRELEGRTGLRIAVTVTENTSTMLTMKRDRREGRMNLRIHRMFLAADTQVIDALAEWLARPKAPKAGQVIDGFIKNNRHRIRRRPAPRAAGRTQGACFDLQRLYDEVNAEHFANRVDAGIAWGRMPGRGQCRRSIRFGSYTQEDNLVRIHPLLDQAFVPEAVVRYIVFHEMLHADIGIRIAPSGRRLVHPPAFQRREKEYPGYAAACAWLDTPRNLARLLAPLR